MSKLSLFFLSLLVCLTSCELSQPDFFVPKADFESTEELAIEPEGRTGTLSIASNTNWVVESSMSWLVLSETAGQMDGRITFTIDGTKVARRAEITLYPVEVPDRISKIIVRQAGVVEISEVSRPQMRNLVSITGTTADASAEFDGYSLGKDSDVKAWFVLNSAAGPERRIDAKVNNEFKSFAAALDDLVPGVDYSITAYAQLDGQDSVAGASESFKTELIPPTVTSVGETTVSGLVSETGTTAKLSASLAGTSLVDPKSVAAGFTISALGVAAYDIPASVDLKDQKSGTFSADIENLEPDKEYTAYAWAKVVDGERVKGGTITFTPSVKVSQKVTIVGDFTTNDVWKLPTANGSMAQKEVSVTDAAGYTWTFSGACIADACLWLACQGKKSYQGYVLLPKLPTQSVTRITFPNDGKGLSGKASITLSVSTDNGKSYKPLFSNIKLSNQHVFDLSGQQPGSIYKIQNDFGPDGSDGYSKTTKITIEAE